MILTILDLVLLDLFAYVRSFSIAEATTTGYRQSGSLNSVVSNSGKQQSAEVKSG